MTLLVPAVVLQPPFYSRDVGEMYDGILHKPLQLPPGKSDAVSSLLVGLLQKDQHRRLGAIADFVSSEANPTLFVKALIKTVSLAG